jgi:Ribbon-helix-helix protein, copG family
MKVTLDPSVRAARLTRKLVIHEQPEVAAHLARLADEVGVSQAALVRAALRDWLRRVDPPRRAR